MSTWKIGGAGRSFNLHHGRRRALGRVGYAIGIALCVASAQAYTAAWIRIYEARGPDLTSGPTS